MIEAKFIELIAREVKARPEQVEAAIGLFDKGGTVPFVARYRKDVTGNLDEVKLETIEERNVQYTAIINRRDAILENIAKQDQLTDALKERLLAATDMTTLEDLYLPFRKQRRTKASVAREQGLEPLADFIWAQHVDVQTIESHAAIYVDPTKGVNTPEEAVLGARNILAERVSVDPDVRALLRETMLRDGVIVAQAAKGAEEQRGKFDAYHDFKEALKHIPSHRLLAVLRGVRVGALRMDITLDDTALVQSIADRFVTASGTSFEEQIRLVVEDAYKRLLRPAIENEVTAIARSAADDEAIHVFRENAQALLLAPPAGRLSVLGVDPGLRTGSKLAVVDTTGNFVESSTILAEGAENTPEAAEAVITGLVEKHGIQAVAIGNGTGSREIARFINEVLKKAGKEDVFTVFVNEAGASVYSASKTAREEFPDMDITIRGAVSIARRLQDPLSELVKLEPRSVGVGQYQHDVNQKRLREGLYKTVESCVNHVGVDLNTASVDLLRYVSGIQMGTAQNIVQFRTEHGGFKSRQQLAEVSGIGEKTYQQCAGFLRITGGENPLDATSIHPEAYPVVEQVAEKLGAPVTALIENPEKLAEADFAEFRTEIVGDLAIADIRKELEKPGRDPRREFRVPKFLEGVDKMDDIEEGMEMEGVVTNVTDFGAFVDVGVHQDGLVHLSELANKFVRDPREVVKVGEIIKVRVIKVDKEKERISLSRKALLPPPPKRPRTVRKEQAVERKRQESAQGGTPPAPQGEPPRDDRPRGERPQRGDQRASRDQDGPRDQRRPQRPRPQEGGPRRDRQEGGPRPERRDSKGPRRGRDQQRGGGARSFSSGGGKSSGMGEGMNTSLADQLAGFKDKLNDEKK